MLDKTLKPHTITVEIEHTNKVQFRVVVYRNTDFRNLASTGWTTKEAAITIFEKVRKEI